MFNDSQSLFEIIVCPKCKQRFSSPKALFLDCVTCRLRFDVVDGIPILIIEKAARL
ncbi:Trm112 family protein [bacterium]|nr:Trm112 family protein [bacterium]